MSGYKPLPRGLAFKVMDEILRDRYYAVDQNPRLIITNRWDQSDCFYNTRKKLDAMGYDVTKLSDKDMRKRLTEHIKDWCDRRGLKRHGIGIFAADRAVLAFQGNLYSVSFENYEALARLGVDIICVEKEGIVDKQVPFTTDFGIGLVQSEGFVSEYGEMLAQEAKTQGANVTILTDFDASGIVLAHKINGVIRLGAHLGVLDEFNEQKDEDGKPFEQLDPLKLMESYNGGDHWTYLWNLSRGAIRDERSRNLYRVTNQHDKDYMNFLNRTYKFNDGTEQTYIDFIRYKRIELNTIMDEVGAERFWNWLKEKIIETFPTRDYNRAITVPKYVLTPTMETFQDKLKELLTNLLKKKVSNIKAAYRDTNGGLLETPQSYTYTYDYLQYKLEKDDDIKKIDSRLKRVMKKLSSLEPLK